MLKVIICRNELYTFYSEGSLISDHLKNKVDFIETIFPEISRDKTSSMLHQHPMKLYYLA